jgi:branched-subunit amino acid ABC-type transport system permease component
MSQAWVYRPIRGEGRRTAVVAVAIALGYVVFVWSALARLGWLVAALVLVAVIGMVLCFGPRRFVRNVACRTRGDPVMPLLAALGLSLALQHGTAALISSDPRAWPELLVMYSWEELDASATAPAGLYVFGPGGGKEVVCRAGESVPPPGLARQGRKGLFANRRPSLQTSQWLIVIALIASGAGLFALVRFTRAGKAMRALSWDPEVARLMGVRPDRTYTFAFLVGGFLAGVAGVLWAMRYGRIDPYMGQLRGLKAFVAAVIGGRGSVLGAILGGLLLGLIETIAASSGFSGQRDALAFVVLILVLLVRPHGLLGRPEGEKV